MKHIDFINKKLGKNTILFGSQSIGKQEDKRKLYKKSPNYTTDWNDLATVI